MPCPAGAERGRARCHAGPLARQRSRGHHRAIVEQIVGKGAMRFVQGTFNDHCSKTARVDEQIGVEALPVLAHQSSDIAAVGHHDRSDFGVDVNHPARRCDLAQILPDQHGVEMIAIAAIEREVGRCQRRSALIRQPSRNEKEIGMRGSIDTVPPQPRIGKQIAGGMNVEVAWERVEISFEPGHVRPAVERDPDLVRCVATRHPFGLGDPDLVEECLELRGRSLADADDPDVARFDQRHLGPDCTPALLEQASRHPARRAAAKDANSSRARHRQRAAMRMAKPPPGAMCTASVSPRFTIRVSTTISLPLAPNSAVGPSR